MEYLQIFDENGEIIDDKIKRSEKRNITKGKYFMIVLLFLENDNHEILMQYTSKEKDSVYAVPGGHVIYGDTPAKSMIRESKEEMDLVLNEDELEFIGLIKGKKVLVSVFYTKKNIDIRKLKLQKEEVDSLTWMDRNNIDELIKNNEFRNTNEAAYNLLMEKRKQK